MLDFLAYHKLKLNQLLWVLCISALVGTNTTQGQFFEGCGELGESPVEHCKLFFADSGEFPDGLGRLGGGFGDFEVGDRIHVSGLVVSCVSSCLNDGCFDADSVVFCASEGETYLGDGVGCEAAVCIPCPPSLAPEIEVLPVDGTPMEMNKVRYLAFSVPESGQRAVQVTFDNLPSPFDIVNGTAMWVTEPRGECETAGHAFDKFSIENCGPAPGLPTNIYKVAELQCDPLYRDWSGDGVINVYGELIVPNGTYSISVVDAMCPPFEPDSFSAPLTITTPIWGDVVKDCTAAFNLGSRCGPPDKSVDIVTDVLTVLQKFQNVLGISKSRADIEPGLLDGVINISDVTFVVGAFSGDQYPFAVPELCPPVAKSGSGQ